MSKSARFSPSQFLGTPGKRYKIVAGVLYAVGDGTWAFIDDANHTETNISSITIVNGKIRINYNFTAKKIHNMSLCPDDKLVQKAMMVGGDVGTAYTNVYFYRAYKEVSGLVQYNAGSSTWGLTAPVGGLTVTSFGSAGTGVLRVSHDNMYDAGNGRTPLDINVTPFDGYWPKVTNVGVNYVDIKFFDNAGTLITAPDANMKFLFGRRNSNVSMDPTDTGLFPLNGGNNIWVYGVFEV